MQQAPAAETPTTLGMMLTSYGQKYDRTDATVADEIGIGRSTFCRIKQGKLPDAENLAKIISWMVAQPAD